jgi:glycosyltransferase involved in cell wall biosynthesis
MIVVHVTHEAVEKMGGIGTVIDGLTTAEAYNEAVSRTILVGPLFSTDKPANERLGPEGEVLYSTLDELRPPEWREKFAPIEKTYDVGVIYGKRVISEPYSGKKLEVEALVFDVFHSNVVRANLFKGELYEKFGVRSAEFDNVWEYEQYIRMAEPAYEALRALGVNGKDEKVLLLAHEYMGMPVALKTILDTPAHLAENVKTVFYAHEVASVRPIVEDQPGHDTMFYNVMAEARQQNKTLEELFPSVHKNFKHGLVKAARFCDHIFAVGDYVVEELKFLDKHFARMDIDLVYNGIPAEEISLEQKRASRDLLGQYAENLFGQRPTWFFTHVARPVRSKGIWRDLRVLHALDGLLAERGETAIYIMLGTLAGERRPQDILQMERNYGWPVTHEYGYPDLCGGEEVTGEICEAFNKDHHAVRALLVNQWGFHPRACGHRMPKEMSIADLRRGGDVEFGLSIYEPFGISQLEMLSYGGLCVVSNVCGCVGFAEDTRDGEGLENVISADFLGLSAEQELADLLSLSAQTRDEVETREGRRLAKLILERLPRGESAMRRTIETGAAWARRMSWDNVVRNYFLPSLSRAAEKNGL